MKRILIVLTPLLIVALAACGGGPQEVLPTVATLDDDTTTETQPTEEPAADLASGDDNEELRSFITAEVSGAEQGRLARLIGVQQCIRGITDISYTNMFNAGDGLVGGVTFQFFPGVEATTYVDEPASEEQQIVELRADVEATAEDAIDFTQPTAGEITLTSVPTAPGEAFAGTYAITIDNRDFLGQAEATAEVIVSGEFVYVMDELCEPES
ncbi:MAG: hypothetical protein AAF125_15575 [Chloroflexota bacterium]